MSKFNGRSASYGHDPGDCSSVSLHHLDYIAAKKIEQESVHENPSEKSVKQPSRITRFIQLVWKRLRLVCTASSCESSATSMGNSEREIEKNSNDSNVISMTTINELSISSEQEVFIKSSPIFKFISSTYKFPVKTSTSV